MKYRLIIFILKLRGVGWGDEAVKPFDKWLVRLLDKEGERSFQNDTL